MFETIVFSQSELLAAIDGGCKHIGLCDNAFTIPDGADFEYTLLGDAYVSGGGYAALCEEYEGFWVNGYGINLI